jgi:hypothetical protein
MKRMLFPVLALIIMAPLTVQAQDKATYGPFTALKLDAQIVEDVRVEGDNIYVKVHPDARSANFTVKVADQNMADYRKWYNGTHEMVVKVYQGPKDGKQGHTYRVSTTAPYIEYYLDGKLILQLKRVK